MRIAVKILAALGVSVTLSAAAASFDCAKAASRAENAVCASARLSELDDELTEQYRHAVNRTPDAGGARTEIRDAQRAWLRGTRDACSDDVCLESVYSQGVGALKAARALYDEAVKNAEQEDENPPPDATADTSAPAPTPASGPVEASPPVGTTSEASSNPSTPTVAASAPTTQSAQAATPPPQPANVSGPSMGSFNSGHLKILMVLAAWLGAIAGLAIWLRSRGQSRLVAWGGGFLATTVVFAFVGRMMMPHRDASAELAKQAQSQALPTAPPAASKAAKVAETQQDDNCSAAFRTAVDGKWVCAKLTGEEAEREAAIIRAAKANAASDMNERDAKSRASQRASQSAQDLTFLENAPEAFQNLHNSICNTPLSTQVERCVLKNRYRNNVGDWCVAILTQAKQQEGCR